MGIVTIVSMVLRLDGLTHRADMQDPAAALSIELTRESLNDITLGKVTFDQAIKDYQIKLTGGVKVLGALMGLQETLMPCLTS